MTFWGPVHRHRAGGRVHRDTAPIISCLRNAPGQTHRSLSHVHHTHHTQTHHLTHTHLTHATHTTHTTHKTQHTQHTTHTTQHTTQHTTHTTHTTRRLGSQVLRASVIFVDTLAGDLSMAARALPLVSSGGSAVRRRERRLRSFWRHEQMAIQMALATVTHHSFQVGTAHDALRSQKPVTSAGGMRPPPLVEGRPQVRIQRHTVEQRIEHTPYVQILDALVPQKVEQLVDFFKDLDSHVPVQVIEVPKISQDIILQRSVNLVPQMAEQLVEVPTLLSVAVLQQRTAEQIVGIPGRHGRLQGLSQDRTQQRLRLSRLLTFLLPVEIFKVFAQDRVQQRFQSRTFPLQLHVVVVFTVFLPFKAPQWLFPVSLGDADEGVFRTFPRVKKERRLVRTPGRHWPRTRAHPRQALMAW